MNDTPSATGPNFVWLRWPEVWAYAVLSLADIALTYVLIGWFHHEEVNPVARYFIYGWGLEGMVWFKLSLVAIALAVIHFVRPHRPVVARNLARLGVLTVALVDLWSTVQIIRAV